MYHGKSASSVTSTVVVVIRPSVASGSSGKTKRICSSVIGRLSLVWGSPHRKLLGYAQRPSRAKLPPNLGAGSHTSRESYSLSSGRCCIFLLHRDRCRQQGPNRDPDLLRDGVANIGKPCTQRLDGMLEPLLAFK